MSDKTNQDEIPGLVSGKLILLALLLTVVACAGFWLVANDWVRQSLAVTAEPLRYADRAAWPTPPVKHTTMERPISNYVPSGPQEKWKVVDLRLAPLERKLVDEAATLAAGEAFTSEATRERLDQIVAEYPQLWYPRWLLGQWHAAHGDADAAGAQFERAYAQAPAVLMVPYVDRADLPAAELSVGTIVLGVDQSDGKTLDQSLRLVYPALTTDATGRVYLPAYHAMLRVADWPEPAGHAMRIGADYQWLEFPGRVAQLRPTLVWEVAGDTAAAQPAETGRVAGDVKP